MQVQSLVRELRSCKPQGRKGGREAGRCTARCNRSECLERSGSVTNHRRSSTSAAVALVKPNDGGCGEHCRDPSVPLPSPWSMASSQETRKSDGSSGPTHGGVRADTPMQDLEAREHRGPRRHALVPSAFPLADSAKAAFGFLWQL